MLPVSSIPKAGSLPQDPTVPFVGHGENDQVPVYDAPESGENLLGDSGSCASENSSPRSCRSSRSTTSRPIRTITLPIWRSASQSSAETLVQVQMVAPATTITTIESPFRLTRSPTVAAARCQLTSLSRGPSWAGLQRRATCCSGCATRRVSASARASKA